MKFALIAHDGKKAEMVAFLMKNFDFLKQAGVQLVATGTTGSHVERAGLEVQKVASGPRGGDAQIAAMVTEGIVHCVMFFRDPLDRHPHEPDIAMLMRLCDVHNVPLATNPATAQMIVDGFKLTTLKPSI
jgi:methylglyoxal synthase